MPSASASAAAASGTTPSLPGRIGTPAAFICAFASLLSPICRIESAEGPMKAMPLDSTISANWGFSLRKPYPGWIASACEMLAALRMRAGERYDSRLAAGPMQIDSSASRACQESRSASE